MKNKASDFLKQILNVLTSLARAKTLAIKNKTSAMKTRLIIFSLLRNKKVLLSSISHKFRALLGKDSNNAGEDMGDQGQAIVLYNAMTQRSAPNLAYTEEYPEYEEEDGKYPDLTHSLFDLDDDFEDPGGSVIDLVRHSKEEEGGEFKLEDEIDQVADLFIKRFHRQMRFQKQLSLKRHQEMLQENEA